MTAPTPEQLRFILESAILAPSADNRHPMRFELVGGLLKVWHTEGVDGDP